MSQFAKAMVTHYYTYTCSEPVCKGYGKSQHHSGSYTPAVSQFVKPMASHSSIVGSTIIGFRKYSKGCSCIPCRTPSNFVSSIVIPLPIQHPKFQLNRPPGTRAIGRTVGQLRLKTAKIFASFMYCHTPMKFKSLIPMSSLNHLLKFQPNWLTGSPAINCGIRQPRWKLPFSLYHQKFPLTKVFYISTDRANFGNMRSQ